MQDTADDEDDSVNPVAPETLDAEDSAVLRGDAVGDTVYTHRWVLSCIFTITQSLPHYLIGVKGELVMHSLDKHDATSSGEPVVLASSGYHVDRENVACNLQPKNGEQVTENSTANAQVITLSASDNVSGASECEDSSLKSSGGTWTRRDDLATEWTETGRREVVVGENSTEFLEDDSSRGEVLELDEKVENAACQLWDMTMERDVSLHILNLSEVDILQLAALIINQSRAPRLTEVIVGVIANLCCLEEGCQLVLKDREGILSSSMNLLGVTGDIPTLCEVVRLLRLLLWHRRYRTTEESWTDCLLLTALQEDPVRGRLIFFVRNCLSESLLSCLLEFLESLLFVWLPNKNCFVASCYSVPDMIKGLLSLMMGAVSKWERYSEEKEEGMAHRSIQCLYAFVDNQGAQFIQQEAFEDEQVESQLFKYLEKVGCVTAPEQLMGDVAEHLICVIGLGQLLVPCFSQASVLFTVARLLAITHGHAHHYTASRGNSLSETNDTEVDLGWLSPPVELHPPMAIQDHDEGIKDDGTEGCSGDITDRENNDEVDLEALKPLQESLGDYCAQLIGWWWLETKERNAQMINVQQCILNILDQCHAHELRLIFSEIRTRNPSLVPALQEYILDRGEHRRLVVLLADMYQ